MAIAYPNGIGGTLGDSLATAKPFIISGAVWYVNSVTGIDAVGGTNGQNRERPLATLAQAVTNSAGTDVIVLMDGCQVSLTGVQSIGSRFVVGEGLSGGIPTATINFNAAGQLNMNGTGTQLRGVRLTSRSAAAALARVSIASDACVIRGCYIECGANDTGPAVSVSTALSGCIFRDTTFISTGVLLTAQPESAMKFAGTSSSFKLDGLVFDAGTVGFSNFYALDMSAGIHTNMDAEQISLLRGADVSINSNSTGFISTPTVTGGSRVNWT